MNKVTALLFLLLLPRLCFTQSKSEAAQDYLGTRFEDIAPKGKATWFYRDIQIQTSNAGDRTWKEELTNRLGFTEKSAGPLQKVILVSTYDGNEYTIPKSKQPKKELVTKSEPPSLFEQEKKDSASFGEQVGQAVNYSNRKAETAREAWSNLWKGTKDIFSHWKPFFFLVTFLLWWAAAFTGGETLINQYGQSIVGRWFLNIHNNTKAALGVCVLILGVFYMTMLYMYLYETGLTPEVVFVACVLVGIPMYKLANKFCTDLKIVNTAPRGNGGFPNPNKQLRLGE